MIEINKVYKTFRQSNNDIKAINDVSLRFVQNKIHGIIGTSGAGKSTLIRLINKLEDYDFGTISVLQYKDIRKLNKESTRMLRREIGMIFQHFNLLDRKTVLDNVLLPIKIVRSVTEEDINYAHYLLEQVELTDYIKSYPSHLSGGQKQRVGIARALINRPKLLLCDEPTSALDTYTKNKILNVLKKVKDELQITIIVVTHDISVVKKICDTIIVMKDGEVIESGLTKEVFMKPKQVFTKELIDYNNINVNELLQKYGEENHVIQVQYDKNSNTSLVSETSIKFEVNIKFIPLALTDTIFGLLLIKKEIRKSKLISIKKFIKEKGVICADV